MQICKAALSSIMGVEPQMIKEAKSSNEIIYLYYRLEGEKERFGYRCKVVGNRVMWGSQMGRWRDQKDDEVISYQITGNSIIVKEHFNDEPESEAMLTTFDFSQL